MTSAGDVLDLVRSGRASTRSELRRLTGLSRTAVVARVSALAEAGLLLVGEELASTGGRPPGSIVFHQDAGVVLAAAIGRSRSQLAVFDLVGEELGSSSLDHEVGAGPEAVMPPVAQHLCRLLDETAGGRAVLAVGVSLPGTVDPVRGVSVDSPVMGGWDGADLAPYLAEVGAAPLYVGNDADVLARSERLGHAARFQDLLVVKASTGLGLGIIAEGRVVSGHLGGAGEIGHTKVDAADGRPCRCGATGCLETLAGGWALVARLTEQGRHVGHVRDLVDLALSGDADAKQLLRESGRRLGEVLAVAINLLNPEAVVLGGDMAAAFDVYAAGVRESVYARASALATRELQFLPSTFGDRAGLVGCASMALDQVLNPAAIDARLSQRPDPS
ncbi:ROK family protein [Nocardioides sp. cx-173]|uniref:ROK family transcriptional regulator n=1 Tax=Nocardioides sp. cx-173 TaxID=2898796 RepID=UPI001E4CD0C4|nr:ROK family protein [Nocardioides sp. cx-173]MCD4523484.1 ROK family protein [Nocardioides sp. cx-173]UGB42177.1 ROK family protein [Nocardioides sp. cx-173]